MFFHDAPAYSRWRASAPESDMISERLGHTLDKPLAAVIKFCFLSKIHPTCLTLAGLVFSFTSAGYIITDRWKTAAVFIMIAGLCDMLDGAAARMHKKTSAFGGFIDCVVDRYSDLSIMGALIIYFAQRNNTVMVTLSTVTVIGIALVPYARARAETFIHKCNKGFLERPERIILILLGCLFNIMVPILWIMAVLTHITVIQRIYWTWLASQTK